LSINSKSVNFNLITKKLINLTSISAKASALISVLKGSCGRNISASSDPIAEELENDNRSDVELGILFLDLSEVLIDLGFLFMDPLVLGVVSIGSLIVSLRGLLVISRLFESSFALFLLLSCFLFPILLSVKSSGISHASRPNSTDDLALLVDPQRPRNILSSTKFPKKRSGLLLALLVLDTNPSSIELFFELPKLSGVLLFEESNISKFTLLFLLLLSGNITKVSKIIQQLYKHFREIGFSS
jgi:hypothetical protein